MSYNNIDTLGDKALEWDFKGYEGKYIICYYITSEYEDNVYESFNDLEEATEVMDSKDLWEDYYIYYVGQDGFAYQPQF